MLDTEVRVPHNNPPKETSLSNVIVYVGPPVILTFPMFMVRRTFTVMSDASSNNQVPVPVVTDVGRIVELAFIITVPEDRLMLPPIKEDASSISRVFPFISNVLVYPEKVMDLQYESEFRGQSLVEFASNIMSSVASGTPAPPTPPEAYDQFRGSAQVAVTPCDT